MLENSKKLGFLNSAVKIYPKSELINIETRNEFISAADVQRKPSGLKKCPALIRDR